MTERSSSSTTRAMTFEPAGNFLFIAAKKYNLEPQALAGLLCERVSKFIDQEFKEFSGAWVPTKFDSGELTICVSDAAASSALFLRTHEIIDRLESEDLPARVEQILIMRRT